MRFSQPPTLRYLLFCCNRTKASINVPRLWTLFPNHMCQFDVLVAFSVVPRFMWNCLREDRDALTCLGKLCRHAQGGPRTLEGVSEEGPAVTFHFRLLSLCVFYLRAVSLIALCLQHTPSTHPSMPAGIQLACCGTRGRMELRMKESPFCNAAVNSMGRPKMLVFDFFCFCFSLIFLV